MTSLGVITEVVGEDVLFSDGGSTSIRVTLFLGVGTGVRFGPYESMSALLEELEFGVTKLLVRGRGSGDVVVMTYVGVTLGPAAIAFACTSSAPDVKADSNAGATVSIGGLLMSPFRSPSPALFKFWS